MFIAQMTEILDPPYSIYTVISLFYCPPGKLLIAVNCCRQKVEFLKYLPQSGVVVMLGGGAVVANQLMRPLSGYLPKDQRGGKVCLGWSVGVVVV